MKTAILFLVLFSFVAVGFAETNEGKQNSEFYQFWHIYFHLINFICGRITHLFFQNVMIRNSSVILENALHPIGNVTAMMIAATTVTNKIVVCMSWVSFQKSYIPYLNIFSMSVWYA